MKHLTSKNLLATAALILVLVNAWCYLAQFSLELDTILELDSLESQVADAEFNQNKMIEGDKKLLLLVSSEYFEQLSGLAQKRSWIPLFAYYQVYSIKRSIHDTHFAAGYLADKYKASNKPEVKD